MKSHQSSTNKKLETALAYARMGISVIPWGPKKNMPLLDSWTEYQTNRASEDELRTWWKKWPNANPFGVMGAVSGIVMLDIDKQHNRSATEFDIPLTASTRTPQGGNHFFFKHPGFNVQAHDNLFGKGVDFKGDGGLAALPGTKYINGGSYEWLVNIEEELAEMPQWLLEGLSKVDTTKKWQQGLSGVTKGSRNDTAASMAGKILTSCPIELQEQIGWGFLKTWNQTNKPPLKESELRKTWESIKKTSGSTHANTAKESQPDKLIKIISSNPDVKFFRSELQEPFIQFPVQGHKEYWPCKDKHSKLWLSREFWNNFNKSANSDAVNTALNTIQGLALFEGEEHALSNRIASYDNDIYYSLSNDSWESVKISKEGWAVEANSPILFRRYQHQAPQATPVKNGDVKDIFKFININNPEHRLLFIAWLISAFIPDIPQPILYIYGPQGSAKSTTSRFIKKIIDPSKVEVSEIPKDQKELVQKLSHHRCLMFDNVSYISQNLSDILCRAVTGSGFSKRELYSDDSDIIYTFKRCISINGINLLAVKPDLLERSVLIELGRITKKGRKNEQDLLSEFDEALPGIVGGIMDAVSKAMTLRPDVNLQETPRMADFTIWGYAISEALGFKGDDFLQYYTNNIELQHEEVVESNIEASFVLKLMEETNGSWEGSASDLLTEMEFNSKYGLRDKEIPKTPQILSRRLNVIRTSMEECGIKIEFVSGQKRKIIIQKVTENIAPIAPPSQEKLINDEKHENNQK